ncbi:MAG: DUF2062 domain-containing protein [Lentisphaeria bacterium]|jgi:uncharacterized protein (DUF2062 family)|nr:DUF2062 domain-containing protein [Lentisphaeria bacterium]
MPDEIRILLVIPVYNHAGTLPHVVAAALAVHDHVLVVDDGSSEPVESHLKGLAATVLRHPENRGKGAAIRTAAVWAASRGFTHIVTLDADGQHDPAQFPAFRECIEADPQAVVIGVRDFGSPNVPGSSRFGRSFGNFWVKVQTGLAVGDIQSGYRAYPVRALTELTCFSRRFAYEVEIVVRCAWAGLPIRQLPIPVHYPDKATRISHFHLGWDNLRLTVLNTHLTLRSIVPWPHRRLVARAAAPRGAILHPLASIRRLLSQNATPVGLGLAAALGMLLGTLPLIALHTVSILVVAGYFRLNKPTAVGVSQLCMPPLVPALCVELGHFVRHGQWLTEISWQTLGREAPQRLWEYVIGATLLAPVLATLAGLAAWLLALAVQRMAAKPPAP